MVRFTQMLTNKGELGGESILKPETVDFLFENHIGADEGRVVARDTDSDMAAVLWSMDRPMPRHSPTAPSAISASMAAGSGLIPRTSFPSSA